MKVIHIDKISIYDDSKFCVFPSENAIDDSLFSMVYRAARGVYWNKKDKFFYITVKKVHVEWCFNQIAEAIAVELGYVLLITDKTEWDNVCPIDKKNYDRKVCKIDRAVRRELFC